MVTVERIGLQFLIVVLISIYINAALSFNTFSDKNGLDIVSKLLGKRSRPPLIIVVNRDRTTDPHDGLRSSDNNQIQIDAGKKIINETIDEEKAKRYVKAILRSTGDENDPIVKKTNMKFKSALRNQCAKYTKCEIKCKKKITKKKKDNCQKSCKEVFDYLMICHPLGDKKKTKKPKTTTRKPKTTKKDSCESSLDCGNNKDSCASRDSCAESKDSCQSSGGCKCKDSCEETEEVTTRSPSKGKTMPPSWPKKFG